MILILTGPVRSHKTTTLMHWALNRKDCGGLLTPDADGLRMLYNVKDKTSIPFQRTEKKSDSDIIIGKFIFDADAFDQSIAWISRHLSDPDVNYLLLDEIGPLELSGKGFDHWLRNSLFKIGDKTLILVVREKMVDEVIKHYHLNEVTIVGNDYFSGQN